VARLLQGTRIARLVTLCWMICLAVCGMSAQSKQPTNVKQSQSIRPAMILWGTGAAAGTVETITPAVLGTRKTWRITHYPQDPTSGDINNYDLYDLDQLTLEPVRSVMNTEQFHIELMFYGERVTLHRTSANGNTIETIPISMRVEPEGPGLDVFIASLPLAVGYHKRYAIVDRWGGHDSGRLKMLSLTVFKRSREDTPVGKHDVYHVLVKPDDSSFEIKEKVLARTPHYPVRVEYSRDGKAYPASEVRTMVFMTP
jgi:hypothetical protein